MTEPRLDIFGAQDILRYVQEDLERLPDAKKARLTVEGTTEGTIEVRYAYRIEGAWKLGAAVAVRQGEAPRAGVFVEKVW